MQEQVEIITDPFLVSGQSSSGRTISQSSPVPTGNMERLQYPSCNGTGGVRAPCLDATDHDCTAIHQPLKGVDYQVVSLQLNKDSHSTSWVQAPGDVHNPDDHTDTDCSEAKNNGIKSLIHAAVAKIPCADTVIDDTDVYVPVPYLCTDHVVNHVDDSLTVPVSRSPANYDVCSNTVDDCIANDVVSLVNDYTVYADNAVCNVLDTTSHDNPKVLLPNACHNSLSSDNPTVGNLSLVCADQVDGSHSDYHAQNVTGSFASNCEYVPTLIDVPLGDFKAIHTDVNSYYDVSTVPQGDAKAINHNGDSHHDVHFIPATSDSDPNRCAKVYDPSICTVSHARCVSASPALQALHSHTFISPTTNTPSLFSARQNPCNPQVATPDLYPLASQYVFPSFTPEAIQHQANIIATIWPAPHEAVLHQAPEFFATYEAVKKIGLPNSIGAKIQIESGFNLDEWDSLLQGYFDREICTFFRFGWPVGYHSLSPPDSVEHNHPSARQHLAAVKKFVDTELALGALVGPFSNPPFTPWCRCSPLMTRPKRESTERRVIVDLSYPIGHAVNDGIDPVAYFGRDISYSLPSIGDLISLLQQHGKGALVWKADLARAYRQLRIDPLDSPLLALKVDDKYYIDRCPSFGCRTSSAACQRMSNALVYLMAQQGFNMLAYLDDFTSCHKVYDQALSSYNAFVSLASRLGLQLAEHKCVPPTTNIEWLGYAIDTNLMTVAVPFDKLLDLITECEKWATKSRASKKMIQALAGRMLYVANGIKPARRFTARILATLRAMGEREWTTLSSDFKADVAWFVNFAAIANGRFYYTPYRVEVPLECDSSLHAAGGVGVGRYYEWIYSASHKKNYPSIVHLEAINLLVTYRTFAPFINQPGVLVVVYTDNLGSAYALESGKTRDDTLANCSRELWLEALKHNHLISIRHRPGSQLLLPDALSRQSFDPSKIEIVHRIVEKAALSKVCPSVNNCMFFSLSI